MHTLYYIIILILVVGYAIKVLVSFYKRCMHLDKMADFYREKTGGKYSYSGILYEKFGYISGQQINREIEDIKKRFKKDPNFLKETEKAYYEEEHRKTIEKENQKKDLIVKRVFAYDYEDLLFRLYEPTAKEYIGGWRTEGIAKNDIIKRIAEIKSISKDDAEELFKILVDHDLIWTCGYGCGYELTPMLQSGKNGWDIVSYTDMNFKKWMIFHLLDERKKN